MGKGIGFTVLCGKVAETPTYAAPAGPETEHQLQFYLNVPNYRKDPTHPDGGFWEPNVILVRARGAFVERWSGIKKDERLLIEGTFEKQTWSDKGDLKDDGQPRKKSLLFVRATTIKKGGSDNFNTVVLLGRAGDKPEIKYFDNGGSLARLPLAINVWNRKKQEEEACWIDVEVQGKKADGNKNRAESASEHVTKGSMIAIQRGLLVTQTWDNERTGKRERKTFVKAFDWQFEGAKGSGAGGNTDDGAGYDFPPDEEYPFGEDGSAAEPGRTYGVGDHRAQPPEDGGSGRYPYGGGNPDAPPGSRYERLAGGPSDPNKTPNGLPRDPGVDDDIPF